MAWSATVTNVGAALLAQWAASGDALSIDGAKAGTERVETTALMAQTDMAGTSHNLSLTGTEAVDGGVRFGVMIAPEASAYSATQIGIWASLNGGASTLLAIYQGAEGDEINVPSRAVMPDFAYTFSAVVMMDNTGQLTVNLDPSALVSQGQLASAIAGVESEIAALGDPVTIPHGGTGAQTKDGARTALTTPILNGTWTDAPVGLSYYSYEGVDTTEYNLPSSNVDVLVLKRGSNRGSALAIQWMKNSGVVTKNVWKNTLHGAWGSWVKISVEADPLPVANGGTGVTASPSMLTNLASTAAADVLQASPRPGVTGTLPLDNGGTGATDAATARTNLGAAASATATLSSFSEIPTGYNHSGFYNVNYSGVDADAPVTTSGAHWWTVVQLGHANRTFQLAADAYSHQGTIWYRKKHDSTWYGWYRLGGEAITVTVSKGSGSDSRVGTVTATCRRDGNIVSLYVTSVWDFSSTPLAAGGTAEIVLSGLPAPVMQQIGAAYTTVPYGVRLTTAGHVVVRNISGAALNGRPTLESTFTYITA